MAAIGIGFLGSPQVFVRFISMKDEKQILPGTITAGVWTVLADSGAVLVGIFGRAIYAPAGLGGNVENILPEMALGLLPAFFADLFIAMVLSAIMSTIDSLLVVASSAGVRDYWQKSKHPGMSDDKLMSLTRQVTLSLCWSKLTGLGAKCAMVAGLMSWSGYLEALDVLLPSFVVGFLVAIVVSLKDAKGQSCLDGVAEELRGE